MKHVKKIFVAAVMALVLTVSTVGMVADAAGYELCSHYWTVEEYVGEEVTSYYYHQHSIDDDRSRNCRVDNMEKVYIIRCRACGTILSERRESTGARHTFQ